MDYKLLPSQSLSQWIIFSEIALSLYPQLIKLIPASLDIQLAVRFITYSILAIASIPSFDTLKTIKNISITNTIISTILMGIVNIIHIASSYYSFSVLSSGFSYSLFYTYPIFNLLGRYFINNEYISPSNYLYISVAILGVYLIYNHYSKLDNLDKPDSPGNTSNTDNQVETRNGLFAGICSAITESAIYLMVKNDIPTVSPFIQIIKTYLLGGMLSIGYLGYQIKQEKDKDKDNFLDIPEWQHLRWDYWITLILFNALVGFVGYVLRFYLIPKTSTILFNSLIFTGVIFAYLWGYILSNENIYIENILGTALILGAIYMINKK